MTCHKNNNHKSSSPIKHILHMVLCCSLPILIITAVPFLKFMSPPIKNALLAISPFICPIITILMIPMMLKGMNEQNSHQKQNENTFNVTNNIDE